MYDQIFEDFNTIKEHYERNGNNQFEESAVFELLESLYPLHGSAQAIQTIIDMLDAQRIRDTKITINKTEASDSEKSSSEDENENENDNDNDIIEIEVPKKVHPFIDLTENSTESDEAVIIEKTVNKGIADNIEINSDSNMENNDSEASCHEIHSLSDSDASKHYNEDSNLTCESVVRSNSEKQLLNYLTILDQPNQISMLGEQSNNELADIPEMLEENNNDPNNNFDEENASGNHTLINNANVSNILHDTEPPNSDDVLNELFNGFDPIPIPGCSKEITPRFELNGVKKHTPNYNMFNPVPGCSKDLDIPPNIEPFKTNDDSIETDITTIQEIIPWAASDKIRFFLMRYSNSSDRKQATLLRLMREESPRIKKRKSNNDALVIDSKVPKVDNIDEIDDSLDIIPNLPFDNIFSNESSNDSQSSKRSGHLDSTFKTNQNLETFSTAEFPVITPRNKWSHIDSNPHSPSNLSNSNIPLFSNSTSNVPTMNLAVKKERNETIVSGLLLEQKNLEMLNGKNPTEKLGSAPSTSVSNQPINEPFFANSNVLQFPLNNSLLGHQTRDEIIEKTVKEEPDNILNDTPTINGLVNHPRTIPSPNKDRLVIQPPKLRFQNPMNPIVAASPPKSNFMRPAVLNFNHSQQINDKPLESKEKYRSVIHTARSTDYVPPELRPVAKAIPLPNRIQLAPSIMSTATVVREHQAEKNLPVLVKSTVGKEGMYKKPNFIHFPRPFNMSTKPNNVVTIVENPTQDQPAINNSVPQPGTSGLNSNGNSGGIPDQSIYNKLRSIFPDVKSSYIKKICVNPPNIGNTNDKSFILNALIEHLLKEGSNHLRPVEYDIDRPSVASVSVDEKYEYLLGIFPDADPTYIRDFVVKNASEQEFEQFIQQKLESRDYPTKEQYMARIKITEQIKQYTTDLNIERFLELFPDPFKHFEDVSRKCTYQPIAMEFLKSLFVRNKVATISQQYKNNHYNLSLTARALTNIGNDMKSKRVSVEMPTEDIPLLQEMAFIKNKQNIINHLNMLKNKEEQLFKELKDQNLLLTCQCCYNDECMPTKSSECNEGHVFCHECIVRGTESALADAEAHVRCFTDCQSEFSLATLQKVLPPTKFSALLQKRQTAEVIAAGVDGLVSCPFCHFASIPPPEDKVFKCLNPECMKETCRKCKELNHVPLKCDEVIKTDKARHLIEEKMTEALVRTCYKCKKQFYKEDGCNKMKCTCGALMCYLCSKPIKGYNHFNAQGGANTHLCPLWSDDRFLNATAVIKVAEDMKKQLLKNNPSLQIDTDSLLPKVPPKTRGPHDDIPNANQLPEHILRIANGAQR